MKRVLNGSDVGITDPQPSATPPRRRRRPSGEPALLPRATMAGAGKVWAALVVVLAVLLTWLLSPTEFFLARGSWWDDVDRAILEWVAAFRTDALTDVAQVVHALRADWLLSLLRWLTIGALLWVQRWRHLGVFVLVILGTEVVAAGLTYQVARVRPDSVEILTEWAGFSFPSVPLVAFTATLMAMTYALAVPRMRLRILRICSLLIVAVGVSRIYLGVDRFTDALGAVIIAVAFPLLAFRFLTPDAVFPVSYSRSKTAHLDLTGRRKEAILEATHRQLGLDAIDVRAHGLEGSGGSTPLVIPCADGRTVFAKLYAQNHLRSDRWYKLSRSLLYGALEDEAPYRTVRRLAEHEDHMMHLMRQAGVPVARSLGIAEITPGREYLIVTEFIHGAAEANDVEWSDTAVRTAMAAVRAMWDAGLAHRDIKPANLLVRDDAVFFIDHSFGEIRPTPWREAADLANLMLTVSIRRSPEDVHRIAGEFFTESEIGEAFAVARAVTIPGQLKTSMRETGRDIVAENRALAPARPPIGLQRWTPRRIWALTAALTLAAILIRLVVLNRALAGELL